MAKTEVKTIGTIVRACPECSIHTELIHFVSSDNRNYKMCKKCFDSKNFRVTTSKTLFDAKLLRNKVNSRLNPKEENLKFERFLMLNFKFVEPELRKLLKMCWDARAKEEYKK